MADTFSPPRRTGLLVHLSAIFALLVASIWSFNQAARTPIGSVFTAYLLGMILLALPIPFVVYRLYGLLRSSYAIRAGSLYLRWGLRVEEVPLDEITWVRTEMDINYRLPLPLVRWPGSLLGTRRLDRRSRIEYMASRRSGLVLIETQRRVYAISPEDPEAFLLAFQRASEMGYFEPVSGRSLRPGEVFGSALENRPARLLLIAASALAVFFAAWIILYVSPEPGSRYLLGETGRTVNSTQIILLPVLNSIYTVFDVLVGLFFFRRAETRPLAYLLWTTSIFVSALFFTAGFSLFL